MKVIVTPKSATDGLREWRVVIPMDGSASGWFKASDGGATMASNVDPMDN